MLASMVSCGKTAAATVVPVLGTKWSLRLPRGGITAGRHGFRQAIALNRYLLLVVTVRADHLEREAMPVHLSIFGVACAELVKPVLLDRSH